MTTKILNLQSDVWTQTIQFFVVAKDHNLEKKKFLLLAKDSTDEITICFNGNLYERLKVGRVYQLSGFVKKLSTMYILTKYILYTSHNAKILDVPSKKITEDYFKMPKEIQTITYIDSARDIQCLNSDVIVNIKAKLIKAIVKQDCFYLTIELEDMNYTVRITHLRDLTHLRKDTLITLKRIKSYKSNDCDSVLFSSTMFTQIFESENKPSEISNIQPEKDLPITQILEKDIVNKRYKKKCKVLYFKFLSFYSKCGGCGVKYTNYSSSLQQNQQQQQQQDQTKLEEETETFCSGCHMPLDNLSYATNLDLTVVEAGDKKHQTPFTILLFDAVAVKFLKNTGNNIKRYLETYSSDDIEKYFVNKIVHNYYEFTIHQPYVKKSFDAIYKRFYCTDVKLLESNKKAQILDIEIIDDADDNYIDEADDRNLIINQRSPVINTSQSDYNTIINNHNEIPTDLYALVDNTSKNNNQIAANKQIAPSTSMELSNQTNKTKTAHTKTVNFSLSDNDDNISELDDNGSPYAHADTSEDEAEDNVDDDEECADSDKQINPKKRRRIDSTDDSH